MAPATATILMLALVLLFTVVLGYVGPAIDDHSAEYGAASDSIAQTRRDNHLAAAGKKVCGENAAVEDLGNGSIQCRTKRGFKTMIAKVAP
jgi:hypothetical protein